MTQRVNSIDYLRGALALSVMIYHYVSWGSGSQGADTILGRLGIYAVASFYVVSGISLYLVYSTTKWSTLATLEFIKKRALRIYPLYILATLITIAISKQNFEVTRLVSNLFLVFGFYAPSSHIPTGGWSVGNEVVFYSLFPFLMLLMRSSLSFVLLIIASIALHAFFAFYLINANHPIASQSPLYMNPLNQIFFFIGGLAIGKLWRPGKYSRTSTAFVLLLGLGLFLAWPASGDRIDLISGWNRITLSISCLLICLAAFMSNWDIKGYLGKSLKIIGDTSYSTYLLHGPIALFFLLNIYPKLTFLHIPNGKLLLLLLICAPLSILAGYLSFHKFESPIMRLGKRRQSAT